MKILILGAGGMLGHKLYQTLSKKSNEVYASFRKPFAHYKNIPLFDQDHTIENLDVFNEFKLIGVLDRLKPDVICNAICLLYTSPSPRDS